MSKKTLNFEKSLTDIQKKSGVVGRDREIKNLIHCLAAEKNVLLEGPVGVGKTFLVSAVAHHIGKKVIRVDGDARYTEQKLIGWFDPPAVLKKGYSKDSYFDGPLAEAMREGALLFINELNRMPEGVQNVLLPALDERKIEIPRVGVLTAKPGFAVLATQNPREFVATSHLSEALLDRFELISLEYQSEDEEKNILMHSSAFSKGEENKNLVNWCVNLVRHTRESTKYKRGASIRAGISIYDIAQSMGGSWEAFHEAALLALPTRVEFSEDGIELGTEKVIEQSLQEIKKKSLSR